MGPPIFRSCDGLATCSVEIFQGLGSHGTTNSLSTLSGLAQRALNSVFLQLHPHLSHPHRTSSTLHAAPFPATVGPEKEGVLGLGGLTLIFSALVYGYGIFIVNAIVLVVK